jgi:HEAT repeats
MRLATVLLTLALPFTGCTLYTIDARSGSKQMPVELRSSSDRSRPLAGVDVDATTRPAGAMESVRDNLSRMGALPRDLYELLTMDKVVDAATSLKADDADMRRVALNRIAGRKVGRGLPYTDVYKAMGQFDDDASVRAAAVRAINQVRDRTAVGVLVAALADGDPMVRLEAAKALANMPTVAAEAPLRAIAENNEEDLDTRLAAIDALRHYKTPETQRTLVSQLNSNTFALSWQARRSLFLMTGKDMRYNESEWNRLLAAR